MKLREYLEERASRDEEFRLKVTEILAEQNADLTYLKQSVITMKGQLDPVCKHVEFTKELGKFLMKGITLLGACVGIYVGIAKLIF